MKTIETLSSSCVEKEREREGKRAAARAKGMKWAEIKAVKRGGRNKEISARLVPVAPTAGTRAAADVCK